MRRAARGDPTRLPARVLEHVVATTYGMSLEAVRDMPADDYLDAIAFLPVTSR